VDDSGGSPLFVGVFRDALSARTRGDFLGLLESGAQERSLNASVERDSKSRAEVHDFYGSLRQVASRSRRDRLPYALLLFEAAGTRGAGRAADGMLPKLRELFSTEQVFVYHLDALSSGCNGRPAAAVILPATGLKRARKLAGEAQNVLRKAAGKICVGVGACGAGRDREVNSFLREVEESLAAARSKGDAVRWQAKTLSDNSCQVTAEERQQLFSW